MSFQFLNAGRSGDITEITPIDTFIDPVSKIRVSNPSNLIDTDFEYGLQPTKWETVELINNTPAFFSRGGDTTIPDITGITTNAGTREITVTTAFPHNLDVGIPVRVAGTKSVTADGSYIINATPTPTTFTYLSRANQAETISIFDLYTSIISGEFFQGSQISISDAEGMVTDGEGPVSTITVKTETKHGFGPSTPFYFLNLNSTISQEFESQNSASVSFDPTNSATAQEFDGSNTLLQTPIDLSNSATSIISESPITSTSPQNATISVSTPNEDWSVLDFGDPLYYSVNAGSGYFQQNPRGVVFIKSVDDVDAQNQTATFQVSQLPDGDTISIVANMTGFFQIADQARTFAGNNVNEQSQIELQIEVGEEFLFDGGNQGFDGDPEDPLSNVATVVGYTGTSMTVFTAEGDLDYYTGAMLRYSTDGNVASGLENNRTYFVTNFAAGASAGLYTMSIAELPGGSPIDISGGSGAQIFSKIGVSVDKNIVHIRNSNFEEGDLLEYTPPPNGNFLYESDTQFRFLIVSLAYDDHNYLLDRLFQPMVATGGNTVSQIYEDGELYNIHVFLSPGSSTFTVSSIPDENFNTVDVLLVGGGGGAGDLGGGGGGAGGLIFQQEIEVSEQSYTVVVGDGGPGQRGHSNQIVLSPGGNSSAFGLTAIGGGPGQGYGVNYSNNGGSGGGGNYHTGRSGGGGTVGGSGTPGQGNGGGSAQTSGRFPGGGGGGWGAAGQNAPNTTTSGNGGIGRDMSPFFGNLFGDDGWFAGGGGGGWRRDRGQGFAGFGGRGGGGRGDGWQYISNQFARQENGKANTGGGGGGGGYDGSTGPANQSGGNGGSGIVMIKYKASSKNSSFINASGGKLSVFSSNGVKYALHCFSDPGTFTFNVQGVPATQDKVDVLLVGGGGGGGDLGGGGGGAGGLIFQQEIEVSEQSYTVVVGDGGPGQRGHSNQIVLSPGGNSSAFGLTAIGGGPGQGYGVNYSNNGGSGGGGNYHTGRSGGGGTVGGSGTPGQGNNGGDNVTTSGRRPGGGGGGWGAAGGDGVNTTGGSGGIGRDMSPFFGNAFGDGGWFAGGGGGGFRRDQGSGSGGLGGKGGGGRGDGRQYITDPVALQENGIRATGGGGGGGGYNGSAGPNLQSGGNGGSGVVIIRYPIGQE